MSHEFTHNTLEHFFYSTMLTTGQCYSELRIEVMHRSLDALNFTGGKYGGPRHDYKRRRAEQLKYVGMLRRGRKTRQKRGLKIMES